jgi:hypothetical protein
MAEKISMAWVRPNEQSMRLAAPPEFSVRLVGALLALAVAGVHVADQGGITAFNSPPDWLGWAFRIIEVGGVLTAVLLLLSRTGWLGWAAGALLGLGPFVSYLTSRSIGLPGDPADVGNWGYWVGTVSLMVEAALVILSVTMLLPTARAVMAGRRSSRGREPADRSAVAEDVSRASWGSGRPT